MSHFPYDDEMIRRQNISLEREEGGEDSLERYIFNNPEAHDRAATANVMFSPFMYRGTPVLIGFAARNIAPYEQMGFSYGTKYWLAHFPTRPLLFNKDGSLVPKEAYRRKWIAPAPFPSSSPFTRENIAKYRVFKTVKELYEQGIVLYKSALLIPTTISPK